MNQKNKTTKTINYVLLEPSNILTNECINDEKVEKKGKKITVEMNTQLSKICASISYLASLHCCS